MRESSYEEFVQHEMKWIGITVIRAGGVNSSCHCNYIDKFLEVLDVIPVYALCKVHFHFMELVYPLCRGDRGVRGGKGVHL